MEYGGPAIGVANQCERVLRSLPMWFAVEGAITRYAEETETLPTFVAREQEEVIAFLTLQQHFPTAWEVTCIAVHAAYRNQGVGRALHTLAECWLVELSAVFLQVKTIAESNPSPEYVQTRKFYAAMGYTPLEVFPLLWAPQHPALQLVKLLS